jgi:poly(3-hydroxybutyrate) depolymerase
MRRHDKWTWAGNRRALVYEPGSPPPEGGHPILCFLHGAGEAALDAAGRPQSIDKLLENGSPAFQAQDDASFIRDFLVICPQLEARRRWHADDAQPVVDFVAQIAGELNGNPDICHLTGFSYGGEGVFIFAAEHPDRWSSLWSVTPAAR